jgi:uncharacterized membrane protein
MTVTQKTRLHLLDSLRGFMMVNMIAYHAMWDLVNLFGVRAQWYSGAPKYIWQQCICWTFILLSGFCWRFSRNHLRRGALVFGGGVVISVVTNLVMPASRILFGILTCIGSCVLLMIPLEKVVKKIPSEIGAAVSLTLFVLLRNCAKGNLGFESLVIAPFPDFLYRNWLTAYLGFPYRGFFSTDYFGVLPWIFLFLCGYFLFDVLGKRGLNEKLFAKGKLPLLNWMGRNSLLIYMLHQPVVYGILLAADYLHII